MIDFEALKKPFPVDSIKWRVGSCGKGANGIWAKGLAYIDARHVQDRLDEVVGPDNWKCEFNHVDKGVMCGLSTRGPTEYKKDITGTKEFLSDWVTKWDGAEPTAYEPFKGGISDAFKRAAVHWGIGRYLYALGDTGFLETTTDNKRNDSEWVWVKEHKDKNGNTIESFYFRAPTLPDFAITDDEKKILPKNDTKFSGRQETMVQPAKKTNGNWTEEVPHSAEQTQEQFNWADYKFKVGKNKGKRLGSIDHDSLVSRLEWFEGLKRKGEKVNGGLAEDLEAVKTYVEQYASDQVLKQDGPGDDVPY